MLTLQGSLFKETHRKQLHENPELRLSGGRTLSPAGLRFILQLTSLSGPERFKYDKDWLDSQTYTEPQARSE